MKQQLIKNCIAAACGLIFFSVGSSADISLLRKYSHKTTYNLEQVVFKADHIVKVKKNRPLTIDKKVEFPAEDKCPPYISTQFSFKVIDIIGGKAGLLKNQNIIVKEPFSDLAYTVHYSYYKKGFVIEPFIGQYYTSINFDSTETMILFINTVTAGDSSRAVFQFSTIDAFESIDKRKEIEAILNRPPADMKNLFLKKKTTGKK
jgi:hypothetical protein